MNFSLLESGVSSNGSREQGGALSLSIPAARKEVRNRRVQTRSQLLPSGPQTLAHCVFIYRPWGLSQLRTLLREAEGPY